MALDFPNSPIEGQRWVGDNGITYVYSNGKWTGYTVANLSTETDRLVSGAYNLILETNGETTFPGGSKLIPSGPGIDLTAGTGGYAELQSANHNNYVWVDDGNAYVATDWTGNGYTWTFGTDGNLILPTNVSRINYANGQSILEGITSTGSTVNVTISSIAPVASEGALWYQSTEGRLYVNDGNVWIDANPTVIAPVHDLIPEDDQIYSLGSADLQWKDLFVSNNTIYMGGVPLTVDANGTLLVNGNVVSGGGGGANLTNGSYTVNLDADGAVNLPNNGVIRRNGAVNMVATK